MVSFSPKTTVLRIGMVDIRGKQVRILGCNGLFLHCMAVSLRELETLDVPHETFVLVFPIL